MSSRHCHCPVSYEAVTLAQSVEQAGTWCWPGTAGVVSARALHTCPRAAAESKEHCDDARSPKQFILIKQCLWYGIVYLPNNYFSRFSTRPGKMTLLLLDDSIFGFVVSEPLIGSQEDQ